MSPTPRLDSKDDASAVVRQARSAGRGHVVCIVLGRGADWETVVRWLQVGASVPGFGRRLLFATNISAWAPWSRHRSSIESKTGTQGFACCR
jgi:hypothetical protein